MAAPARRRGGRCRGGRRGCAPFAAAASAVAMKRAAPPPATASRNARPWRTGWRRWVRRRRWARKPSVAPYGAATADAQTRSAQRRHSVGVAPLRAVVPPPLRAHDDSAAAGASSGRGAPAFGEARRADTVSVRSDEVGLGGGGGGCPRSGAAAVDVRRCPCGRRVRPRLLGSCAHRIALVKEQSGSDDVSVSVRNSRNGGQAPFPVHPWVADDSNAVFHLGTSAAHTPDLQEMFASARHPRHPQQETREKQDACVLPTTDCIRGTCGIKDERIPRRRTQDS